MKVLQEISKVATSSLPTQVVAATVGAKLQQFKDGGDSNFVPFSNRSSQPGTSPARDVTRTWHMRMIHRKSFSSARSAELS